MRRGLPFGFEVPVWTFEKGNAPKGQKRRIGGIISTDIPDFQGEQVDVLKNALDFNYFKKNGWFNDNHSKDMSGIVGYPEKVETFKQGDALPNGMPAPVNGYWAEGYLLDNKAGNKVWETAEALKDTGRQLGYSVEGRILRRSGPKTILKKGDDGKEQLVGNTIAKAIVRNVAVTHCPVNDTTGLEILAKSISAVEMADPDDLEKRIASLEKALTMGTPTGINPPEGPQTGENVGQILVEQSLDCDVKTQKKKKRKKKDEIEKSLTDAEAVAWVQTVYPTMDVVTAGRVVEITKTLKRQGRL